MSQKMTFLDSRDNKWYWAVYNDSGDFAKLIGPFHSLEEANRSEGVPELTPSGEYIKDETPVVSVDEAKGVDSVTDANVTPEMVEEAKKEVETAVDNTPVETPTETNVAKSEVKTESTEEVKAVPTETIEVSEDGKTATFEDGSTAPIVPREEVVAQLGEEKVAEIENQVINENKESAPVEVNNTDSTQA